MVCRSPFGELILRHRRQLGLSQGALARRINQLADQAGIAGRVSAKTIYNHEAERAHPGEFAVPRVGTIGIYAEAFRLARGSPERQELLDAAEETKRLKAAALSPRDRSTRGPGKSTLGTDKSPRSTDFVVNGRERAWARLQEALDAALGDQPQLVLLEGEAGIGKTRLLVELGRQGELSDERLVVAVGRCIATTPYHAAREVLALLIGDIEGAGTAQLLSPRTGARLRKRAPEAIEAVLEVGPRLIDSLVSSDTLMAQAMAVESKCAEWRERYASLPSQRERADSDTLLAQIAAVLRRYAASGPLVLVFDDLHQATSGTLNLLEVLSGVLRQSNNLQILLLGAYRSRELGQVMAEGHHPLVPVLSAIQQEWDDPVIDLAPSAVPVAGRAYVEGRLDLVPNRLGPIFRDELYRKTSGVPLFVENALRTLHNRGHLRFDPDGALIFTGEIAGIDLPPTTRAIIGERLRDLPAVARQALAIAAVQGEQFIAEAVTTILQLTPKDAATLLDGELVAVGQLLVPGGVVTVAGKRFHRYQFAHAVYREYLLECLGPLQREHHLADTARALVALVTAEQSELSATIANLFEQAGDHGAAEHHLHAGTYALNRQDPEGAAAHFERVLVLADRRVQREIVGQAMMGLGHCLRKEGKFQAAVHKCKSALQYGQAVGSVDLEAYALVSLGLLEYDLGELTTAESHLVAALPKLRQLADERGKSRAEGLLGHVCYGLGRYDDALAHADDSLFLANKIGDETLAAESRLAAANCFLDLGRYESAIATYEEAITRYQFDGNRRGEAICRADIGLCQIELEDLAAAIHALRAARAIGEDLMVVGLLPLIELYCGLVFEAQSDWRAAEHAYFTALRLRRRAGQGGFAIDALAGLLRVKLATGQQWVARRLVWGIGQWLETHGSEGIEEPFRVAASCVAALDVLGECAAANRLLQGSVALLRKRGNAITSSESRDSYFYRVPANRFLLERAGAIWQTSLRSTELWQPRIW